MFIDISCKYIHTDIIQSCVQFTAGDSPYVLMLPHRRPPLGSFVTVSNTIKINSLSHTFKIYFIPHVEQKFVEYRLPQSI